MKNHDKEVLMIEKQYNGFSKLRHGLQKAIDDHALSWFRKKKKSAGNKFKKTAQVIKAATTFQNKEKRELPRPVIRYRRVISPLSANLTKWTNTLKHKTYLFLSYILSRHDKLIVLYYNTLKQFFGNSR